MVKIDAEKCIGCGLCVGDCLLREISIVEEKAVPRNKTCYNCGHCIAICPVNAVSPLKEEEKADIVPMTGEECKVDTEAFLNLLRFRRTIRKYKADPVEKETLEKVLEAGRISPTGMNSQEIRYIVVQDKLADLTGMCLKSLSDAADVIFNDSSSSKAMVAYGHMWKQMEKEYNEDGTDRLFYGAPALVVAAANTKYNKLTPPIDAGIACANIEIIARTLGLGTCYIGFLKRAVGQNPEINDFLGLNEHEEVMTSFIIGYPDVKYFRTVSRKKDKITWL